MISGQLSMANVQGMWPVILFSAGILPRLMLVSGQLVKVLLSTYSLEPLCSAVELFVYIFHSFKAGIASANSIFK